jgi:dGTP triphosphohydrolase
MAEILADVEDKKDLMRIICDHIAGMTDNYALAKHQEIYGTSFGL